MVIIILIIHVSIIVTVHVQQLRAKHRYREEKLLRYFDMDEILWCDHSLVAMVGRSVAWWHKKTAVRETKQTAVEEKNKKMDMTDLFDFPVHDYTQEQNGRPCFSSIVWHTLRCAKQHKAFAIHLPKMSLNLGSNSIWYFSTYSKSSSVPNTLAILTSWK